VVQVKRQVAQVQEVVQEGLRAKEEVIALEPLSIVKVKTTYGNH